MESNFGETSNLLNNEEIPSADLDRRPEIENDDVEETNIDDEDDEDYDRTFNIISSLDWVRDTGIEPVDIYRRLFGDRTTDARRVEDFMGEIDLPGEYRNLRFIKYLMDKNKFSIKVTVYHENLSKRYDIEYHGKPVYNEGNILIRPAREFTIENGEFETDGDYRQFSTDLEYLYDKWKGEVLKRKIKKASIVGGVLIAVAGLVSGLALGLKRSGHSMVHDSKMKWKKLTPAEKKQIVIPWTELEKASGKGVIVVGDYLYVIIGGTILAYALRK